MNKLMDHLISCGYEAPERAQYHPPQKTVSVSCMVHKYTMVEACPQVYDT